ncbi:MAG: VTT domain-containing protein [Dehalococcoidia bacterium]
MLPRSAIRRRYLIYHPIVTKLLVAMAALGLLMLIASNEEGKQALNGVHVALRDHLAWAAVLLAILFLISTLSPFFPEFMLPVGAGFIFGVAFGSTFAITAITVAASANFIIARRDGRRVVDLIFDQQSAREIDWTVTRITPAMVFLTWLLPSINFDLISYAAGMSRMRYRVFLALTVTGTVMSSVILAFLGDSLHSGPAVTVVAVLMVYTLVGAGLYAKEVPPWFGGRGPAENDTAPSGEPGQTP